MKLIIWINRILLISAYLFLFAWLIGKNFVFDGNLKISYDFKNESPFISLLTPRGRVDQEIMHDKDNIYYQKLLIDPVYFDMDLPRSFEQAKVQITYKNPYEDILELGISGSEDSENYLMQPIDNKLLNKLINDTSWNKIMSNGTILLQKENKYSNLDTFISSPPKFSSIATYNYELPYTYRNENYKKNENGLEIYKSLRGSHEMYTYIEDEDLDFTFNMQDVNRVFNKDDFEIKVFYENNEVYSKIIEDDGIEDDSFNMSRPFDVTIKIPSPKNGLYKININSSDDIFIRNIRSKQSLLVFSKQIYLGDNVGYLNTKNPTRYDQTILYSNTEKINAITSHSEAYQTITFGKNTTDIDEKHIMFSVNNPLSERKEIIDEVEIPKNDIKIIGNGYFSLSRNHFFTPTLFKLNGDENLNLENFGIKYIITNYNIPKKQGDWMISDINFDLRKVSNGDNNFRFVFSFPYFEEPSTDIRVSNIQMDLFTEPISFKTFLTKSYSQLKRIFFGE